MGASHPVLHRPFHRSHYGISTLRCMNFTKWKEYVRSLFPIGFKVMASKTRLQFTTITQLSSLMTLSQVSTEPLSAKLYFLMVIVISNKGTQETNVTFSTIPTLLYQSRMRSSWRPAVVLVTSNLTRKLLPSVFTYLPTISVRDLRER